MLIYSTDYSKANTVSNPVMADLMVAKAAAEEYGTNKMYNETYALGGISEIADYPTENHYAIEWDGHFGRYWEKFNSAIELYMTLDKHEAEIKAVEEAYKLVNELEKNQWYWSDIEMHLEDAEWYQDKVLMAQSIEDQRVEEYATRRM